jgi:hypothetical protein
LTGYFELSTIRQNSSQGYPGLPGSAPGTLSSQDRLSPAPAAAIHYRQRRFPLRRAPDARHAGQPPL